MVTVSWSLCTEVLHWELYVLGRAGVPVCLKYVKGVGELYVMLRIIPPPFFICDFFLGGMGGGDARVCQVCLHLKG